MLHLVLEEACEQCHSDQGKIVIFLTFFIKAQHWMSHFLTINDSDIIIFYLQKEMDAIDKEILMYVQCKDTPYGGVLNQNKIVFENFCIRILYSMSIRSIVIT